MAGGPVGGDTDFVFTKGPATIGNGPRDIVLGVKDGHTSHYLRQA